MDIESLQAYCLSKKGAEETLPFGPDTLVYKVGGKAFLLCPMYHEDGLRFNVKCDPDLAEELRERYSYVRPGFHMNKRHWNTILANEGATSKQIKEWIDHSYELVRGSLPKKTQAALQ